MIPRAMKTAQKHLTRSFKPQASTKSRSFSSTAKVWVNKDTTIICQGFTGKHVSNINILIYVDMV